MPDDDAPRELLEHFRRWLRERHLPITAPRDLVARAVFAGGEHLSAEGIHRRLNAQGHRVGMATIYRSIEMLVASGLVRAHDFGEGFRRYEAMLATSQHGHLLCARCGKVVEFSTERFERLFPIVADEHDFQHHSHRVEIRGLCRACRDADAAAVVRAGRTR